MKPPSKNHFLATLVATTGALTTLAFAGGTLVTNNTGLPPATIIFMDEGAATVVSGGIGGNDGDANAFGQSAYWGTTVSINYPFAGLTPNTAYNIYSTWHYGGGGVGMTVKVGTTTLATISQNNDGAPNIAAGFTAYDNVNDLPAEPRSFQYLGQVVTDGSGNLTVNAATSAGSSYMRWDCFAVAPAPPPDVYHWDGDATTANDTSDNSSTAGMNWLAGGNWDNGTASAPRAGWNPGDSAVFGGAPAGGQTITLASSIVTGDLTFNAAGYTLTGGTLGGNGTRAFTANADAVINSTVIGSGAFIKAGNGTLTLGKAIPSTMAVAVNAGKLSINTGVFNSLGNPSAALTIEAGATLSADNTASNAHNLGALTLNGATLTSVNGPAGPASDDGYGNWLTRGITVGGTAPSAISATSLFITNGSFTVADATTSPASDLEVSSAIIGGAVIKAGPGTMTLSGANTTAGAITVNEGTLVLAATGSIANSGTITVAAGASFDVTAAAFALGSAKTLAGAGTVLGTVIADGGTITPGAGTLSLGGLNVSSSVTLNFTPGTTLLDVTAANGLNPGTGNLVTVSVGTAPLASGSYHLIKLNGTIQGDGLTGFQLGTTPGGLFDYQLVENGGYLDLKVIALADSWTGALSTEWSTANLGLPRNWQTAGAPTNYANGHDVVFDDSATTTIVDIAAADVSPSSVIFSNSAKSYTLQGNGAITGEITLLKSGSGMLTIANTNTFTGAVEIAGGTLAAASIPDGGVAGPLGTSPNIILSGGTLAYTGVTAGTNRTLALDAPSAVEITTAAATLTLNAEVTGSSLAKTGAGTLTLNFDNTYSGTTRINGGVLSTATIANGGIASPLGQSAAAATNLVLGGGTLQYTGAGTVSNRGFGLSAGTTSAIEVTDPAAVLTFTGGTPASTGALTKLGDGRLVLGGGTAYTGLTTVSAGTLEIVAGFSAASNLLVASGATLECKTVGLTLGNLTGQGTILHSAGNGFKMFGDNSAFAGTIVQAGGIGYTGSSTLSTSEFATWTITSGDLLLGDNYLPGFTAKFGALVGSGGFLEPAWNGSGTTVVEVGALGTDTVCGSVLRDRYPDSGSPQNLALTKVGTGSLTLGGLNTYTGNTIVTAGTLVLADNAQLRFKLGPASGSNTQLTGSATCSVVLDGDFAIDTTAAAALEAGTWQLEDVASLGGAYGPNFTVVDFTDAGNDKWTKSADGKTWTFDETTGTLSLTAGSFATWAAANAVTGGPNGDSDHDGIPNLVEYALNLNFAGSDGSAGTFNGTTLSFTKRGEAVTNGDVSYAIETSPDLSAGSWTPVTPTTNDPTTIAYGLPPNQGRIFARLVVTQAAP